MGSETEVVDELKLDEIVVDTAFVFKDIPLPRLLAGGMPVSSTLELASALVTMVSMNEAEEVIAEKPLVRSIDRTVDPSTRVSKPVSEANVEGNGVSIGKLSTDEDSRTMTEVDISDPDADSNISLVDSTGTSVEVIRTKKDCTVVEMMIDVTSAGIEGSIAVDTSVERVDPDTRLLFGGIPFSADELSSRGIEEVVVKIGGRVVSRDEGMLSRVDVKSKVLVTTDEDNSSELDISVAPDDGAKLSNEEENARENEEAASEGGLYSDVLVASNSLLIEVSTEVLKENDE